MSVLIVTGTGTDVGKTVVTAALAARATGRVAVVKLAQTGVRPGEPGDLAEVTRLSGCTDVHEFARYPAPLSPHQASFLAGQPDYDIAAAAARIGELDASHDIVIVEGAGGLLVPYDSDGQTIIDVAEHLDEQPQFLVVAAAGLGTLNHTALTVNFLEEQAGCVLVGIVIGSWPAEPDLVDRLNVFDLARMAPKRELAGILPAGLPQMKDFSEQARAALSPSFGGTLDFRAFRESVRPRSDG